MKKDTMIKEVSERATDIIATEGNKFTNKEGEIEATFSAASRNPSLL